MSFPNCTIQLPYYYSHNTPQLSPPITTIIPSTSPYHPQNHPSFPSFHPLCYPPTTPPIIPSTSPIIIFNYTIHYAIHLPHYDVELPYSTIHYTHHPSTHDAIHQNIYLLVILSTSPLYHTSYHPPPPSTCYAYTQVRQREAKACSRHRLVYSYAGLASKFGAMCCAACCAVLRTVLRGLKSHLCIFQFLQKNVAPDVAQIF